MSDAEQKNLYDLLTERIAPYASEGDTLAFDRIVKAPVDERTVGIIADCLGDSDADTRRAALFVLAGLQDDTPQRLAPFRPLEGKVRDLLLDEDPSVRCDALMAYAYFDPRDLDTAVHEFLTDPDGRNRLQAVRILAVERNPANIPTLLTLGLDPYHEPREDAREWLLVREAAREAIETVTAQRFPHELREEDVEGVSCLFHVWDPIWQWAARAHL